MGVLLLLFPRRYALLPVIVVTCYMTVGQRIFVAGLDLTMLRVLLFFGLMRIVLKGEFHPFHWRRIDTMVTLWVLTSIVVYTALWQTADALINRLGYAYDAIGLYFLSRCLVLDRADIIQACKLFALVLFPLALCMCVEKSTGANAFYVFGGVPQFTRIREGTLRCQGPFAHPILAGTFGAVWLPMFVGLWRTGKGGRLLPALGIVSSTLITFASGSSGPIATYAAGFMAVSVGFLRSYMRSVRWTIILIIIGLHVGMKEPVWFIFARFNILSGSTGWHRSHLIDQTIKHVSEWWLTGIKDVNQWGVWSTHGHGDVTNQYIRHGVDGGLLSLMLFVGIIVSAFSGIGQAMKLRGDDGPYNPLFWAIGSTLFAHTTAFLSVAYFDQNVVNWYLLLAMAAAVTPLQRILNVATVPSKPLEPMWRMKPEHGPRLIL
jgi:hypothetical protein